MQVGEPVGRLLKIDKVMEITTWKRTAIYKNVKEGRFPAPVKLDGKRVAWPESEVAAWLAAKMAARTQAA